MNIFTNHQYIIYESRTEQNTYLKKTNILTELNESSHGDD